MKIKFKNILMEGKIEDLVRKYPKLKSLYDNHELSKLKPSYVQWIAIQNEPPEDVIGLISVFEKNIQRLKEKDIFKYNAGSLREELESLDSSIKDIKTEEATKIGQFGDWLVIMPHTIRASCFYGRGTQWCTAATKSQNLFLSYVARESEDVVLYYCLNNKIEGPNSKISIGFLNGKIIEDGKDGGITVNAINKGLTNESLKQIFKDQYNNIIQTITMHADQIKGQHPAKKELQELIKNPNKCIAYLNKLNRNEKLEFASEINKATRNKKLSHKILDYFAKDEDYRIRRYAAMNRNTLPETLHILAQDINSNVVEEVASNTSASPQTLNIILIDNLEDKFIRKEIGGNTSASPEALRYIIANTENDNSKIPDQILYIAGNKSASPEILDFLVKTYKGWNYDQLRRLILANTNTSPETIQFLQNQIKSEGWYQ